MNDETKAEIINLFFQENTTQDMLSFFTYAKAYEVTLKNGQQVLVLIPQ